MSGNILLRTFVILLAEIIRNKKNLRGTGALLLVVLIFVLKHTDFLIQKNNFEK